MSSCCNHHQKGECFIGIHEFSNIEITLQPGANQTVFEDFTCNHNKTILVLNSLNVASGTRIGAPISITIRTRGCNTPITATITSLRVFQVEDFESLSVSTAVSARFTVNGRKTFCICCPGEDTNQKCDSCCDKCNDCDSKDKCDDCCEKEECHTCNHCKKCSCSLCSRNRK